MEKSTLEADLAQSIDDLSAILSELRDALTVLSLNLNDWNFEHDLFAKRKIEATARVVLARLASHQDQADS